LMVTAETPGVCAQSFVCLRVATSSMVRSSLRSNKVAGITPLGMKFLNVDTMNTS